MEMECETNIWIRYLAALRVVWSVREQEGNGLQLAMTTIHRHRRVLAAGQQQEVMRWDGDAGAGHRPARGETVKVSPFLMSHLRCDPHTDPQVSRRTDRK